MIREALYKVLNREDLSLAECREVFGEIMEGRATTAQMGAFLAAMRMKGETIDEITACAMVMREKCVRIRPAMDVLDIVGTGGDEANTFNISTVSSFVIAAGGVAVAKHGNRSVSSKCGSADVLEALGVKLDVSPARCESMLREIGICFLFAQHYHSSMKYAAPVRRELGVRTIFNILGPLANPAGATLQLLGVYDEALVEPLARVLANLGVKRAMVVHGHDGLDEVTTTNTTTVCEIRNGRLNSFLLRPEQFGIPRAAASDLVGGTPAENAEIALDVLSGARGPKRDIVVLNAALSLYMVHNNVTLRECVARAGKILDDGSALKKLEQLKRATNEAEV